MTTIRHKEVTIKGTDNSGEYVNVRDDRPGRCQHDRREDRDMMWRWGDVLGLSDSSSDEE